MNAEGAQRLETIKCRSRSEYLPLRSATKGCTLSYDHSLRYVFGWDTFVQKQLLLGMFCKVVILILSEVSSRVWRETRGLHWKTYFSNTSRWRWLFDSVVMLPLPFGFACSVEIVLCYYYSIIKWNLNRRLLHRRSEWHPWQTTQQHAQTDVQLKLQQ